jgi:aryl-alcohol dehydrogenase-like predicted oxidoreductase
MKYRYTEVGLLVSRLTLGTMTFRVPGWGATSHRCQIIKAYLDGRQHDRYRRCLCGGRSESIIGSILPQLHRDEILIATKSYFPMGTSPGSFGASRKRLIASCEASLRRMNTDHVDVYYIHGPDASAPIEESLRALDDLMRQGKVRYVAVSNFFGWQVAKAAGVAAMRQYEPPIAGQFLYNLVHREAEREIVPALVDSGMGLFCYSPLAAGLLTGKYKGMEAPSDKSRLSFRMKVDGPRFWHPHGFQIAECVEKVAAQAGIPMHRLAIAWPLGRRFVTSVIIGGRTRSNSPTTCGGD